MRHVAPAFDESSCPRVGLEPLEPRLLLSANTVILGDYNGSGQVEQGDLDLVLQNWGRDFIGEGVAVPNAWVVDLPVDQIEQTKLDAVLQNWGTVISPVSPDGRVQELSSGVTVSGALGSTTDVDTYSIEASTGELLFVNFMETFANTADPGVFIFNPDGTLLSSVDDIGTGASFTSLTVVQSGTYKIVVRDQFLNNAGTYSLTAVVVDEAVDADNVVLSSGQTVSGELTAGDIDTFTLQGAVGEKLFLNFGETFANNADPGVFIFNPDGSLLSSVDDIGTGASFTDLTLTQTGTYTVLVRDQFGNNVGTYNLTAVLIDDTVDADNVALTSGQTQDGQLLTGDIDTFTFQGSLGEKLFLNFGETFSNTADPGVFIFSPDGSLLSSVDDIGTGASFTDLTLAQTGTYTVLVRDQFGDNVGTYRVTAVLIDDTVDADNVALTSGQTQDGQLTNGDIDTFTFQGALGDKLFLNFGETFSNTADPGVFIFSPDGSLLSSVDDIGTGASFTNLTLAQTGTYTVVVRDLFGDNVGRYRMTAVLIDDTVDVDNVALSSGQTVSGELTSGDIDTFTFSGAFGDSLDLEFRETFSNTADPGVFIFNPDGTLLDSADDIGSAATFSGLVLTQTGTFTVLIRDLFGNNTGTYELTSTVSTPAISSALLPQRDDFDEEDQDEFPSLNDRDTARNELGGTSRYARSAFHPGQRR